MSVFLMLMLMGLGLFLILLILLQKGRGGGLAGAFGGMGGQSALGTKAGDVFTRVTIGVAIVWAVLAGVSGLVMQRGAESRFVDEASAAEDTSGAIESTDGETPPAAPNPPEGGSEAISSGTADDAGSEAAEGATPTDEPADAATPADEPAAQTETPAEAPAEPATETEPATGTEPAASEAPAQTDPPANPETPADGAAQP